MYPPGQRRDARDARRAWRPATEFINHPVSDGIAAVTEDATAFEAEYGQPGVVFAALACIPFLSFLKLALDGGGE